MFLKMFLGGLYVWESCQFYFHSLKYFLTSIISNLKTVVYNIFDVTCLTFILSLIEVYLQ